MRVSVQVAFKRGMEEDPGWNGRHRNWETWRNEQPGRGATNGTHSDKNCKPRGSSFAAVSEYRGGLIYEMSIAARKKIRTSALTSGEVVLACPWNGGERRIIRTRTRTHRPGQRSPHLVDIIAGVLVVVERTACAGSLSGGLTIVVRV